jgi:hypothetical protein
MVLYRNKPYWSLTDSNQGTTPGSESLSCTFWSSANTPAKWIGTDGYSSLSCRFTGGISGNDYYGNNQKYYYAPNETYASMGSYSSTTGATITVQQPITITSWEVNVDIMSDSYNNRKSWSAALVVNDVEVATHTDDYNNGWNDRRYSDTSIKSVRVAQFRLLLPWVMFVTWTTVCSTKSQERLTIRLISIRID